MTRVGCDGHMGRGVLLVTPRAGGDEGARSWRIEPILMGPEERIAHLRHAYGLEAEGFDLRPTPAAPAGR
jgi:hypothetical protein